MQEALKGTLLLIFFFSSLISSCFALSENIWPNYWKISPKVFFAETYFGD